ncbi:hypothetical protein, partial [Streptomyces virginiae]|uniref:hypothetical protein n=1 Tax=Streptomyces virginiae TaxID=1961 RepID=UPI001BE46B07
GHPFPGASPDLGCPPNRSNLTLWWNGRPDNGACPSGNSPDGQHHGQGSWNFYLPANPSESI